MATNDSTMDALRSSRLIAYTVGALALVAGLVLLFWPDRTIVVVARLAGILLVVVGVSGAIEAVTNRGRGTYWGLLLLRGLVDLAFGLVLVFWPGVTVTVVVWLVGLNLVITGVLAGIVSFMMSKEEGRGAMLLRGGAGIVAGIVIMAWPSATLAVLAVLVAIALILTGLMLVISGVQLSRATVVTS